MLCLDKTLLQHPLCSDMSFLPEMAAFWPQLNMARTIPHPSGRVYKNTVQAVIQEFANPRICRSRIQGFCGLPGVSAPVTCTSMSFHYTVLKPSPVSPAALFLGFVLFAFSLPVFFFHFSSCLLTPFCPSRRSVAAASRAWFKATIAQWTV